jgi:hypothetical protein
LLIITAPNKKSGEGMIDDPSGRYFVWVAFATLLCIARAIPEADLDKSLSPLSTIKVSVDGDGVVHTSNEIWFEHIERTGAANPLGKKKARANEGEKHRGDDDEEDEVFLPATNRQASWSLLVCLFFLSAN